MIRRTWSRVIAVLAVVMMAMFARAARADEANVTVSQPRDVPLVLRAEGLKVPAVPATYLTRDLGWIHFAYVPSAHERVAPLIRDAEEIKARLADELGQPVLDKVEVRIARTPEDMATLAPLEAPPPPYGSGVAYTELDLVLLTLTAPQTNEGVNLDEVFRHELAHVALEDAVLHHHVPRWFNEGLAIYESDEHPWDRVQSLSTATMYGKLLPLVDLDRSFPEDHVEVSVAYAESGDFVRFLMRKADKNRFAAMIDRVRGGQAFDRALGDAYGSDVRKLEYQWKEELSRKYTYWPVVAGGSLVWVAVIGALVVGYIRRRRRAKATLARWAKEEAAYDAAVRAAQEDDARASFEQIAIKRADLPKIEHDGRWHTLH